MAFLGQSVPRKARVVYEHTPEWEYYDVRKDALYTGWESSSYQIEMQAEPEDQDGDGNPIPGTPYWVVLGDIAQNEVLPNAFPSRESGTDTWEISLCPRAVERKAPSWCGSDDAAGSRGAARTAQGLHREVRPGTRPNRSCLL